MVEDIQRKIIEFEQLRAQLLNVSRQKQQLQFQSKILNDALEELNKTKEQKVYKLAGNILVLADTKEVKDNIAEQRDSLELRIKALQKQEDSLVDKLNKLRAEIEAVQQKMPLTINSGPHDN